MPNARGYLTAAEARALPPRKCARDGCENMAKIEQRLTGLYCSASCSVTVTTRKVHQEKGYSSNVPLTFFSTWSQEMAYVLGFIIADGHLREKGNGISWELCIACKDWETLEQMAKLWAPTKVRPWRPFKNPNHRQMFDINIGDPLVCQQVAGKGVAVEDKSYTQSFPNIPPEFFWHFLRGYTDGDGGIGLRKDDGAPWINWKAGSRPLLVGIREKLVHVLGSQADVSKKKCPYVLQYAYAPAIRLFNLLYKDAKIYMRRKFDLVEKFLDPEVRASVADLGPLPPKPIWIDRKAQ